MNSDQRLDRFLRWVMLPIVTIDGLSVLALTAWYLLTRC
jgi:hypothetical protein